MTRGFYQTLIVIFLVLYPLWAALDVLGIYVLHPSSIQIRGIILLVGLFLQPIASIGLWLDRKWGVFLLLVSMVLCVFTSFGGAIGPFIMLAITFIRFVELRKERRKVA